MNPQPTVIHLKRSRGSVSFKLVLNCISAMLENRQASLETIYTSCPCKNDLNKYGRCKEILAR